MQDHHRLRRSSSSLLAVGSQLARKMLNSDLLWSQGRRRLLNALHRALGLSQVGNQVGNGSLRGWSPVRGIVVSARRERLTRAPLAQVWRRGSAAAVTDTHGAGCAAHGVWLGREGGILVVVGRVGGRRRLRRPTGLGGVGVGGAGRGCGGSEGSLAGSGLHLLVWDGRRVAALGWRVHTAKGREQDVADTMPQAGM